MRIRNILTFHVLLPVLGILTRGACAADDSVLWTPDQIGSGAFSLAPDQTFFYKTVSNNGRPVQLGIHVFYPEGHSFSGESPAIVFFHGGGWYGGTPDHHYPQCRYLALRGMTAFSVEYRTINAFETTPRECVADGKSAMRWVRSHAAELGIHPDRIAAGGGSAGGHIAAATAMTAGFEDERENSGISFRPDALVLFNPVFDNGPEGFAHGLVKDYWKEISPIDNIHDEVPPAIVILGTKDEYIPVETAERFARLMKEQGIRCDLHLYEDKPHGFYNLWVSRDDLAETLIEVDRFLESLGFLEGEPIIRTSRAP